MKVEASQQQASTGRLLLKCWDQETRDKSCCDGLLVYAGNAACANQSHWNVAEGSIQPLAAAVAAGERCQDHIEGPWVTMGSPDPCFKLRARQLHATKQTVSGCHISAKIRGLHGAAAVPDYLNTPIYR